MIEKMHTKTLLVIAAVATVALFIGTWSERSLLQQAGSQAESHTTPQTSSPVAVDTRPPSVDREPISTGVTAPQYESVYSYPYPVAWKGDDVTYSVMGASLGDVPIPPDAQIPGNPTNRNIKDLSGNPYSVGTSVRVLRLYVKASNTAYNYNSTYDPYIYMKRVLNEEGDMVGTSIEGIASSMGPHKEIQGISTSEVWFIVPKGQTSFTITTGKGSRPEVYFDVDVQPDGTIKIVR